MPGPGSTLFDRLEADAGKMPDAAFYLAAAPRVRGRPIDPASDPVPDLVIEVEIAHPAAKSLATYARMGVPEVWHFREDGLRFLTLRPRLRTWTESRSSRGLPMLRPADVAALMEGVPTLDDGRWQARRDAFVRQLRRRHPRP